MTITWHTKKCEQVTVQQVKQLARMTKPNSLNMTLIKKLARFYALSVLNTTCSALRKVRQRHMKCHLRACTAARKSCVLTTPTFFRKHWRQFLHVNRVVIDEAHLFKTSTTRTVRAIHDLAPEYLRCVTATPQPPLQQAQPSTSTPARASRT